MSAESGDIFCWDLRGGRQATTAFVAPNQVCVWHASQHAQSHTLHGAYCAQSWPWAQVTLPLLHTLSVTALLLEVPALADEVDIESSAVRRHD